MDYASLIILALLAVVIIGGFVFICYLIRIANGLERKECK